MRRPIRKPTLLAPFALALGIALGCASVEGARLYRSGSDALERGDGPRAVADLERAAALLPEASSVQNHLGLAYVEVGRDAEATAAFRRAVDLDCGNEAAQHNLRAAEAGRFRPPQRAEAGAVPPSEGAHEASEGAHGG
jgi:tetratricopeptide (TPR) repeat protein